MRKFLLLLCALLGTVGAWADPVSDVSQLSNAKAYTVVTERGAWWADLDNNIMSYKSDITNAANVPNDANYQFAILKQGDNFFLYSLGAAKFVNPQKYFTTIMPTPITVTSLGGAKMKMTSSNPNRAINIGGNQWTWDSWTSTDGGNTLTITEVDDFDATAALAMLSTQVFTVECQRGQWVVTTDHNTFTGNGASGASSEAIDKQFAFFTNEGKMYLYSVGAEKFVKSDGSLFDGKGDPITFNSTNDATYSYQFYFPQATQIYFNMQNNGASISINNWSAQDAGNKYKIEEVASADVDAITAKATEVFYGTQTITYNIKVNGETVATEVREQKVGEATSLSSTYTSKEYVTYEYSIPNIVIGTTSVDVTATVGTLPFEVSTDFANAHWYNLKVGHNQRYVGWEDSEPYHTHAATGDSEQDATDVIRASAAYQWAFMGNPVSGIKVVNKHTGESYSLTSEGTGTNVNGTEGIPNTVLRSGNFYWDIHENGTGFSLNLIGKTNYYINTHGGATGYFQIWQAGGAKTDGGSRMTVEAVPDLATTVTYNVNFNGNKVFTIGVPGVIGTKLETMPTNINRDYVTITGFDGETVITRDMEVELTATWNGPFEISSDIATAHWYDMAIRSTWYVTSDKKDGSGALLTVNANALGLGEDAYHWAFVGDPWHIQVFNKAEGATKNFGYPTQTNQGVPSFETDTYYWTIKASTSGIANSFVMNVEGTNLYINQYGGAGGSLKFWDSGNNISDGGSAFTVFDIPTDYSTYVASEISPSMESTAKYFVLKPAVAATVGYDAAYKTSCTFEQYKAMKLALAAINMDELDNFVLPETGFYLLKNKNYGTYMGIDPSDKNMYGNYAEANAAKNIIKLTKSGNTYSIGIEGVYAPTTVVQSQQVTAGDTEAFYTLKIPAVGYAAFQADPTANMSVLHCAGSGSIVGWEAAANASQWEAIDAKGTEVDITISDAGYATTYLPFAATIPSTLQAWAVSSIDAGILNLEEITGTLPAGTPVILEGAANTYKFAVADEVAGYSKDNMLVGTYTPKVADDGSYILQNQNNKVGFYQVDYNYLESNNKNKPNIPANRAYLPASVTSTPVKAFYFEDAADAINNVFEGVAAGEIYNLAGQRISKLQKGVNIVNGKKVMVK